MVKNKKRKSNWQNKLQLGDKLYFTCFNNNEKVVDALRHTTKEALTPYYEFLNEAIKAEEEKGSYQIDWKKIESNFNLSITPVYSKFKIEKPKSMFKVILQNINILEETRNKLFFDTQDKTRRFDKDSVDIDKNCIYLDIDVLPLENEIVEINNIEVKYEIENLSINENDILESQNEKFKIENIETLEDGWNIEIRTNKNIKELKFNGKVLKSTKYSHTFNQLFDNDIEFFYEKMGNEYQCKSEPISKILKDENNIEYEWKKINNTKSSDIVIQLIDDDQNDDETISEYFLADDVKTIYQDDNKKTTFDIKAKKIEDKILILRQDFRNPKHLIQNEPIKIKVDTGNLKKQQDSIKLLNNSPVKAQQNLIKLFEKKNDRLWRNSKNIDIDYWYILNNENFDGTIDQREFVKKAIATDDFALLEGPPGSGKTTTILELILQLLKLGKKILLSASTHVAIDNVLERIYKYDIDNNVEALRIGRNESVGEAINHLQIDAKIETYINNGFNEEIAKKIVLDSANLVCGTTMGINQFPPIIDRINFKDGRREDSLLPMDTIFDYMIIDESSKTTFQEFLVPEMLAKKWILVGDIKQLSPFIEQSHIVHNLNVSMRKDTQKAIRIIFETLHNNPNPYIVEVSTNEEREIKKYLTTWSQKDDNPYIDKIVSYSDEEDLFKLLGSDLILINEGTWEERKKTLPKTHIVILKNDNENDDFWFKQNYLNKKKQLRKFYKINNEESKDNNPYEYNSLFKAMLKEQNWAKAISWRMIRVYERRMLKKRDSYYEKTYELLKPVEENNPVDRIYNMTLPSILESIQIGNGENHKNATTITDGFDKKDLKQRHEVLKTQHRMSPDISKFSREEFYTDNEGMQALQNASSIDRSWDYTKYNSRAVWIDTPKSDKEKNNDRKHYKEVATILKEIERFLEFTKLYPKNKDGEPWSIAVLTFYKPQETILREGLRKLCNQPNKMSRFHKNEINILLYTVDKFQGMEADLVFLSMVRGKSIGFMDNINRLNVALTRAKYQRVIVGDKNFFNKQNGSQELKRLAEREGI